MSFETYAYLNQFLDEQRKKAHDEYVMAHNMLNGKSGVAKAREALWQKFIERGEELYQVKEELRYAGGMSYGPEASKATKEFWGLDEIMDPWKV